MKKIRFNLNLRAINDEPSKKTKPSAKKGVQGFQKSTGKKDGDKQVLIMMIYRHSNGSTFKYSTHERVRPSGWNKNQQRAKEQSSHVLGKLINSRLDMLERIFNEILTEFNKKGIVPTNELLRNELDVRFLGKERNPSKIDDILNFIDLLISENESLLAINTLKEYKATRTHFIEWKKGKKLTFSELTNQHYKQFADYLRRQGHQDSTVGKYIKRFKAFINAAVLDERTIIERNPISVKSLGISKYQSDTIYLTVDEIKKLEELNLKKNSTLDKLRDALIVACYTGLRYGDLKRLSPANIVRINGQKIISIVTEKSKQAVEIPVAPIVDRLLTKHNFKLFTESPKTMNELFKQIGELALIDEPFIKTRYYSSKGEDSIYEKWKMISIHTGRRSFVTNALIAQIPPYAVMKMTGHKTLKSFEAYIRFSPRDNALQFLNHPFFQQAR